MTRIRRPIDSLELHDWLAKDFGPINDAWAAIETSGTSEAVAAAAELLNACADLLATATQSGVARGPLAAALRGLAWTAQQERGLDEAIARVVDRRTALIRVARDELGPSDVDARTTD